jgi:hypothetical protein
MTLAEVQEITGVPPDHIIKELGIPSGVEHDERLGRLRTAHGFNIDDVRRIVEAYGQEKARPPRQ